MDVKDKLRTALQAYLDAEEAVRDAQSRLSWLEKTVVKAQEEAVRVMKACGKKEAIFRGRRWRVVGGDPDRLVSEEFNGIIV